MREVRCFLCMDEGFVMVREGLYETYCYCSCQAGNRHRYDERPTGGKWYAPCVTSMLDKPGIIALCEANADRLERAARQEAHQRAVQAPKLAPVTFLQDRQLSREQNDWDIR